ELVGVVRQPSRALVAEGALRAGAPALTVLGEVEDLLWSALGVAVHQADDDPVPADLAASFASFPGRVRALEAALAETGAADVPVAIDVHTDIPTGRVLEETTGRLEEAWVSVR